MLRSTKARDSQVRVPTFNYTDRVTMLGTMCADGSDYTPLFVLKWDRLENRLIDVNNEWVQDSQFDCLPKPAHIAWRENNASADGKNFADFATKFVAAVKEKTTNDRKVLLT